MSAPLDRTRRRWFAPEVVQSSAMDCGPAALKCLLEGFGIPVSYGRLREACQTDVDGTSIDTIETVANALGVVADQILIPIEHVLIDPSALPALVVVRHADEPNHFVVAWRRAGNRVQMMDPAVGRRWQHRVDVARDLLRHETSVPAAAWRAWAGTDAFLTPFGARLRAIGVTGDSARSLITRGCDDAGWFTLGTLDAATRLVASLVDASALRPGAETRRLLTALVDDTSTATDDIFRHIPRSHWSVQPDGEATDVTEQHLRLRGAVLLRVRGRRAAPSAATADTAATTASSAESAASSPTLSPALSPELAAALSAPREHPLRALWTLLRADGLLGPAALAGAVGLASIATLVEALLMRGMFTIGDRLPLGSQRALAVGGLLGFVAIGLTVRLPIAVETLRTGRRLDTRLRMALLAKLPRLTDRYFHSRPLSDLAERSHNIQQLRQLPGIALHGLQVLCELVLTLVGIALIAPASLPLALIIASGAILVPALTQPLINERDLRTRQHAGALGRFYLDALLGLVPIRAHRAEAAVRIQHQSLLVEWARSTRRVIQTALAASTGQALAGTALGALLVVQHFSRTQRVTGADLLLVYWALKVPALGTGLTALAQQYPMQRSILLRLLEPLSAPEPAAPVNVPALAEVRARAGVAIALTNGTVLAAGHQILRQVTLRVAPGEHIGIVGVSGAGKSTLIGLLLGWHRLSEGHLCLDDAEADMAAIETLRTQTAWVDPAVQLWNRPLLDNVTYASRTPDTVRAAEAIEAASLNGVVGALPLGLQTPLGEGGALLSGGEGQRVRLARALAQPDVRLALLDEPFRGMDRDQRTTLLAEARTRWCEATLLCVTHDVSDTLTFDRVLVVERGTIVEDGSPAHLMETASRYRDLLHAEQRVRERLWQGPHWRRIRVAGGRVEQVDAQVDGRAEAPVVSPVAAEVVA